MANTVIEALKHVNCVGAAIIGNTYALFQHAVLGKPLTSSSSTPQHRLQQALEGFYRILTPEEFSKFSGTSPGVGSILDLTSEVNGRGKERTLRRWASYFEPFLEAIQLYSGAIETFVSSNPRVAALVWGSAKIVIIVCAPCPHS